LPIGRRNQGKNDRPLPRQQGKEENGVTVAKSGGREIAVAFTVRDRVVTNSGTERSGSTELNGFPVTQPDARAAKISVAAEQRPRSSQRHVITGSNNEF